MRYDPEGVRAFFDDYGTQEWERLEGGILRSIRYRIHKDFMDAYLPADASQVLDAGCGPGRFALDLARRGSFLTLVDISQVQLDQAHQALQLAGLQGQVRVVERMDIMDMQLFADDSFDAVLCYGIVLSYTFDRHTTALRELVRVLRPGGRLVMSVCSLYGTLRLVHPFDGQSFLEKAETHLDWESVLNGGKVVYTNPASAEFHQPLVMFTSDGLRRTLEDAGLQVDALATANPLVANGASIPNIEGSPQAGEALSALELAVYRSPGLVDAGENLLAAATKL